MAALECIVDEYMIHGLEGNIFARSWRGSGASRSLVFIVHGHSEHSGRYDAFARYLVQHDHVVFSYDLPGYGRSEGKRGHQGTSMDKILDDLEHALMKARAIFTDLPFVLFGHSMGGNIATNFLIRNKSKELEAGILSSPWFELAVEVPTSLKKIARVIAAIWPSFTVDSQSDPGALTRDDGEIEKYLSDPLVHHRMSVGTFFEMERAGLHCIDRASSISLPVLVTHGTDDQVTSINASRAFSGKSAGNIELKEFTDYKHEPLHDLHRESIYAIYHEWIEKQLTNKH